MSKQEQVQLKVPGTEETRYRELLRDNPTPTTIEHAEAFLRHRCVATFNYGTDADVLRVVLKNSNCEEDDLQFHRKAELPLSNKERRNEKIIDIAFNLHTHWLELEREKY